MLGRGLILINGDDREWKLNQLLFKTDTALMAVSEYIVSAGGSVDEWVEW